VKVTENMIKRRHGSLAVQKPPKIEAFIWLGRFNPKVQMPLTAAEIIFKPKVLALALKPYDRPYHLFIQN
jgi:hypothetical protein